MGRTRAHRDHWTRAHEEPPVYPCGTVECNNYAMDEDDLHRCEKCSGRFCSECLTSIDSIEFCPECLRCEVCGDRPTVALCNDCGTLLCAKCVAGPGLVPSSLTELYALGRTAAGAFCGLAELVPCLANNMARGFPVLIPVIRIGDAVSVEERIRLSADSTWFARQIWSRGCSCGASQRAERMPPAGETAVLVKRAAS
jgi:hypothetical protein